MKRLLLSCLYLLASGWGMAQTATLTVADVRQSSITRKGTIEEATLSVRPKGLYLEYGLYLTFSARGVSFGNNGDSLEVVLNFTLPAEAILHDSWLWIGEDIVKARMYDRWTASAIYEGIVNRRQDPSILVKNSATNYQLRVFPMAKNSTRKVKITWLQPVEFYQSRSLADLPFHILKASFNAVQDFNVLVWSDDRFQAPTMADQPDLVFEQVDDSLAGTFYRTSLTPNWYNENLQLQFASPLQDGFYVGQLDNGDEKYYQMAVIPSHFLPNPEHRKVAVLLDYEPTANAPTIAKLLVNTKSALLNSLSPNDSFNLIFSNLVIQPYADHWMPAHPDTINQVFASLNNPIAGYSNLQAALVGGIVWTQQNSGGAIVVATNTNDFANLQASNLLLNDVLDLLDESISIHVVDYNESNSPYLYLNNQYYYASGYFLSNLAALSGGAYYKTYNTQLLKTALINCMANLNQTAGVIDLYPQVQGGFCYGRFDVGTQHNNLNRPFGQVGKYVGEPPFSININGLAGNQPFNIVITAEADDLAPADTLMEEMWYGKFVQALEAEPPTNATISNIIYQSLTGWVLSRYTALLCLENPDWACDDCEDETQYVSTDDLAAADSLVSAAPNPFTTRCTVTIKGGNEGNAHSLDLFSLDGRLVRRLDPDGQPGNIQYEWDGKDRSGADLPPGMYLAFWRSGDRKGVLKLLKAAP